MSFPYQKMWILLHGSSHPTHRLPHRGYDTAHSTILLNPTIGIVWNKRAERHYLSIALRGHTSDISRSFRSSRHTRSLGHACTLYADRPRTCEDRWVRCHVRHEIELHTNRHTSPLSPVGLYDRLPQQSVHAPKRQSDPRFAGSTADGPR